MSDLPLVSVSLASICFESVFYGAFSVLAILSIYLLIGRTLKECPRGSSFGYRIYKLLSTPLLVGSIAIWITISAHWTIDVWRLFEAFVNFKGGQIPILFFADLTHPTEVTKTAFTMATLLICDSMIIYRLWVIWNLNKYVIIFPILTLSGLFVCSVGICYELAHYNPEEPIFSSAAGRWISSDAAFSMTTNIFCSTMIAWKMWRVSRQSRKFAGSESSAVSSALVIFIESATIYTLWSIFFTATYEAGSMLQFFTIDLLALSAGISFMLINVRVGLGRTLTTQVSTLRSTRKLAFPMQPMAVSIAETTVKEVEPAEDESYTKPRYANQYANV